MIEFVTKAILIVVIMGSAIIAMGSAIIVTIKIWNSQIDVIKTISNIVTKDSSSDWVATRDSDKLYRNNETVADIVIPANEKGSIVIFPKLSNAQNLKKNDIIEYKRQRLRVENIGETSAMESSVVVEGSQAQTSVLHNVMKDVKCEKISTQ